MSDTLNITDDYGDGLQLTVLRTGRLDITVTEDRNTEDERAACVILDKAQQDELRRFLGTPSAAPVTSRRMTDPTEALLRVAAQFNLRARFDYRGDLDSYDRPRRLKVDEVITDQAGDLLVVGQSFDQDGESEGVRQFRLDRIKSAVTVR